ncbi:unnamed protein product [Closterium sp. NIES-53]
MGVWYSLLLAWAVPTLCSGVRRSAADLQRWASRLTRVVDLRGGHSIDADFGVVDLRGGGADVDLGRGDFERHVAELKGADFGTSTWRRQPGEADVGGRLIGVQADLELAD